MRKQVGLAALALVMLLAMHAPARAAENALEALATQYKQAGEMIEPGDFEVRGVADADNAAGELRAAASTFSDESDAWNEYNALPQTPKPPLDEKSVLLLQRIVVENMKTMEHIDAAMQRKRMAWGIKMTSPVFEILLPHLNKQRGLAQMLMADAVLMHHQGADREVLRDVKRLMFLSRANDQEGFVVGHLVSLGISAIATGVVDMTAAELKVGQGSAASQEQIKETIALLMDDAPMREGLHTALLCERMSHLDIARGIVSGKISTQKLGELMGGQQDAALPRKISKESAIADGVLMMKHTTLLIQAGTTASDWPTFKTLNPQRPPEASDAKNHPLAKIILPSFDRVLLRHYRAVADQRLAATALAVRAYAAANGDHLPKQLKDLVPQYLSVEPLDPMTAGQALRYDATKAIIYSVGEDGKDDGGSEAAAAKTKGLDRWQQRDAVSHLKRS